MCSINVQTGAKETLLKDASEHKVAVLKFLFAV